MVRRALEEAEPYDLSKLFEEVFEPRTPWEIFLRVLWQLYGDEITEDAAVDDNLPLTSFQKHGVARALRLIRDTGGAIVADEVGLGKTFIAGELLQIYRERRQRALLICPAELRDTTWRKFLSRFQLFVECVSYEELANDIQLRDAQRPRRTKRSCNDRWTSTSSSSWTKRTTAATQTRQPGQGSCDGCCSAVAATSCC